MSERLRSITVNPYRMVDFPDRIVGVHGTGERGIGALLETGVLPGQTTVDDVGLLGDVFFYGNQQSFPEKMMFDYRDACDHAKTYAELSAQYDALAQSLYLKDDLDYEQHIRDLVDISLEDLVDDLGSSIIDGPSAMNIVRSYLGDNYKTHFVESWDEITARGYTAKNLIGLIREAQEHKGHLLFLDQRVLGDFSIESDTFEFGALVLHTDRGLSAGYLWQPSDT